MLLIAGFGVRRRAVQLQHDNRIDLLPVALGNENLDRIRALLHRVVFLNGELRTMNGCRCFACCLQSFSFCGRD